ncbi:hypothetical protein HMPREF9080_01646 [Cardiobacterium valvarum F0432]|uniref:Uncharacterized protein n=1 Tax=Cardiobacterium valvarum F0432 TaxID=797473 RepID=G9ZFW6_9GAMM|nr:hypothetical protein HMPREF9080_01646 [Cardiobacterium valvarum F0432]
MHKTSGKTARRIAPPRACADDGNQRKVAEARKATSPPLVADTGPSSGINTVPAKRRGYWARQAA